MNMCSMLRSVAVCVLSGVLILGFGTSVLGDELSAVDAFAGFCGYGDRGWFVQSPGAQAGAYVYAGTAVAYEEPGVVDIIPDSLSVVFVSHVGRHGARFLSSDKFTGKLLRYLDGCGELTPVGERVRLLCGKADSVMKGRWGTLNGLGVMEQTGIGRRMADRYRGLLEVNDSVYGLSSYVPRCVLSMDELTHGIVTENRMIELETGSGRRFNPLVRFFDVDSAYISYKTSDEWSDVYEGFADSVCPVATVLRLSHRGGDLLEKIAGEVSRGVKTDSGADIEARVAERLRGEWPEEWVRMAGISKKDAVKLAGALYSVVGGCSLSSYGMVGEMPPELCDWRNFFTSREYESLWEVANLKHYLTYSANGLSEVPAEMARPLLRNIVESLEASVEADYSGPAIEVRLGHAETMMPLLSLMDIAGCRYVTTDWGSVADHWMDWNVAPMAANLQLVVCRSNVSGKLYMLTLRNEVAVGDPEDFGVAMARMRDEAGM